MPKLLPVLDQPTQPGVPCCAPLASEVLTEQDAPTLARQFAALGDPVRLRLVSLLANADAGEVCACDLTKPLGKSQPTVSHHLAVLRKEGLVHGEKRGRNIWYSVTPGALEALRAVLVGG
jgi:ArsR family transcriptional regulator